ncbi:hypothetical protein [Niabella ginsengisoli]|uniref:Outer membrane protein beta-barrel domain-containing protein n=1 Tax=Niabella ginsengisoli TaxID=522298 RepID=A0ABS9SQX3_9BACT|nr:hypothetical protein [Niabella ginsengisoli]MCH5600656.1 hypothetical protein [Niabella ginsengisoli]
MHKLFYVLNALFALTITNTVFAQDEEVKVRNANEDPEPIEEKGFKKHNLFTGGGVTASFFTGGSVLGASPVLGYKLNDYVDAGVVLNYVYNGSRDVDEYNDKYRQHVFGPGVFARAFPVPFLFVQAQLEHNFTNVNYTGSGSARPDEKYRAGATSLLLGGGLSTGRTKGSTTFFYFSVLADVLKDRNSPYVDVDFDPDNGAQRIRIVPVLRAGVNIGLFQKRYGVYDDEY